MSNQATAGRTVAATTARFTEGGVRPVPAHRLEERDLRSGRVEILARGQRDRGAVLAIFREWVADEARQPEGRYQTSETPYRLVVVRDGWWSQQTISEISTRVKFAAMSLGIAS